MADKNDRVAQNRPGAWYVDSQCIDCNLCRDTAPNNFRQYEDGGYSYVYKQPESDEERVQCQEALESCPVEAIGNNGDADADDVASNG
ncbi:MAG: ferredoxin [Deltaproteobacteria bacterium]|nr:ferredoxin [Deltaproteobacteria bacterium]